MAGVNDRTYDVIDILDLETLVGGAGTEKGWRAPPDKPELFVENRNLTYQSHHCNPEDAGAICVRKGYSYDRERLSLTYENRVWTFEIAIMSVSGVLLQGLLDQAREVFDRYNSSPWATSTLGTGTTYSYAGIEDVTHHEEFWKYHSHCKVILVEQCVPVVIA